MLAEGHKPCTGCLEDQNDGLAELADFDHLQLEGMKCERNFENEFVQRENVAAAVAVAVGAAPAVVLDMKTSCIKTSILKPLQRNHMDEKTSVYFQDCCSLQAPVDQPSCESHSPVPIQQPVNLLKDRKRINKKSQPHRNVNDLNIYIQHIHK